MIILNPRIDVGGERWFTPLKDLKPIEGLKLLVSSIDNDQYRSRNALIRRHIEKMDASYQVGTSEFSLSAVGEIDSADDLLIDNCARYLLKDWKGVGELVDGEEVPIEYIPERGAALMKQEPAIYWQILAEAASIAQGKEQQKQETVKKPSKRRSGLVSSAGSRAKRQSGEGRN